MQYRCRAVSKWAASLLAAATLSAFFFATSASAISKRDADGCTQLEKPDLTIASCTRALAEGDLTASVRSDILGNRCVAWTKKKEYERAVADCTEAIRLKTTNTQPFYSRGQVLLSMGEFDRAIADFDAAIRLKPERANYYGERGSAFADKGEFDKAMADYDVSIRLEPKNAASHNNRALTWRKMGEFDKAIEGFTQAISLEPRFAMAFANRGEAWRLKGDLERALVDQNRAIALSPGDGTLFVLRGDTKRYKGDVASAISDYNHVLRFTPDYIPALASLGLAYEKMGDIARARSAFEKAVASRQPDRSDINLSSLTTARAHLAALDSGVAAPVIPATPSKPSSATSIPTPTVSIPAVTAGLPKQGSRVALVIGNSAYRSVPALSNPQKDATAISATLKSIGFEVTLLNDATREKLVDGLRNFANEAEKADWAVVYYAGHGMEVGGVNYLVPVDAKFAVDRDIQYEGVPLSQVLNAADTARKIKLVMLDACRDNPFTPRKTGAAETAAMSTAGAQVATRSSNGRGLAEVKVSGATLVVYAAKDGQVALDGDGGNSPFAVAVMQRIATPGVEINKVFRLVRDDVMEATAGRQEPYTYGSLPGKEDFYFVAK